jgi:hypothetical protein
MIGDHGVYGIIGQLRESGFAIHRTAHSEPILFKALANGPLRHGVIVNNKDLTVYAHGFSVR